MFNVLAFVGASIEILKPFIDPKYLPLIFALIAIGNLYIRTFSASGLPIQGTTLKEEPVNAG